MDANGPPGRGEAAGEEAGGNERSAARLIGQIGFFADLTADARRLILEGSIVRRLQPGATLWLVGEPADCLYIVLDGEVDVVRARDGRQHVIHRERAGAVIGDVPLFDGGAYPATAIAFSRVSLLKVPERVLLAAMAADPALARLLLGRLAARVRHLVEGLTRATLRTVRSRVAEHLLLRAGSGPRRNIVVTFGCTQAALAERLGTVRETVSREIAVLRRAGVVRPAGRGGYEIMDFEALERIASGSRS